MKVNTQLLLVCVALLVTGQVQGQDLGTTAPSTSAPTGNPTGTPTDAPTDAPTTSPTPAPSTSPTTSPTPAPSTSPTASPTTVYQLWESENAYCNQFNDQKPSTCNKQRYREDLPPLAEKRDKRCQWKAGVCEAKAKEPGAPTTSPTTAYEGYAADLAECGAILDSTECKQHENIYAFKICKYDKKTAACIPKMKKPKTEQPTRSPISGTLAPTTEYENYEFYVGFCANYATSTDCKDVNKVCKFDKKTSACIPKMRAPKTESPTRAPIVGTRAPTTELDHYETLLAFCNGYEKTTCKNVKSTCKYDKKAEACMPKMKSPPTSAPTAALTEAPTSDPCSGLTKNECKANPHKKTCKLHKSLGCIRK